MENIPKPAVRRTHIAHLMGVTPSTISTILNGQTRITQDMAKRISRLTGAPWSEYADTDIEVDLERLEADLKSAIEKIWAKG